MTGETRLDTTLVISMSLENSRDESRAFLNTDLVFSPSLCPPTEIPREAQAGPGSGVLWRPGAPACPQTAQGGAGGQDV